MTVLVEARDKEQDGTAYFPYEQRWNNRRMPVRIVDDKWRREHWPEIKAMLTRTENARLRRLFELKEALEGKSSDLKIITDAVVGWSIAVQRSVSNIDADLKKHGQEVCTPDGRPLGRAASMPMGPDEAAVMFLLDLKSEPRSLLAAEITVGLNRTRVCLWIDKKQLLQFGLFCPDVQSAIYATAVIGGRIACCLRCGSFFHRRRKDKQFCSVKCQNTFLRARRRREKRKRLHDKKKSSSKGRVTL